MTVTVLSPADGAIDLAGGSVVYARTSLGGLVDTTLDPTGWTPALTGSGAQAGRVLGTGRTPNSSAALRSAIAYEDFVASVTFTFRRRPDPDIGRVTVPAALRIFDALGHEFGVAVEDRTFLTAYPPADADNDASSVTLMVARAQSRAWASVNGALRGRTVSGPSGLVGFEVLVSNGDDDQYVEAEVSDVTLATGAAVANVLAPEASVVDGFTVRTVTPELDAGAYGPVDLTLFGPWGRDTLAGALEAGFATPLTVKRTSAASLTRAG